MTQGNILPNVGGSLLTEKNDKLAQTDRLWRYRKDRSLKLSLKSKTAESLLP